MGRSRRRRLGRTGRNRQAGHRVRRNGGARSSTKTPGLNLTAGASREHAESDPELATPRSSRPDLHNHFSPSGALQSVTDRNGNETALSYDEVGSLEAIIDPAGRKITLSYNGEGLVESAEDPMGHVVQYAYEGGELSSVTMPGEEGPRWQFGYDGSHRMTSMIDGRGGETTNEYDESNRVVSQADPAGRTLAFEYDGFHTRITNEATGAVTDQWFNSDNEPFSITDGFGTAQARSEAFVYDEGGHLLARADANGHTTTYTYNAAGDRTSMVDPEEDETSWEYNATHDVVSETTPRGETTTIERDAAGNPETISRPAPGEATQTTSYEYDSHGQPEAMTDPLGRTWHYEYDSQGDRSAETDPEGDRRTWEYDEDSRLTATVSPRGNAEGAETSQYTTTYERDPQGRPTKVTDPLGHATEYAYDPNGNLKTETDANGHTTTYTYNADDEPTKVERPNGDTTETGYDGAGRVISQTDGNGQTTEYVRDVLEQPVEVLDPLGRTTTREYDAAGNLSAETDPEERTTSYGYDAADRLTEVGYSDESTPGAELGYDEDGNLVSMSDGTGDSSFEYDQLDRLIEAEDGHGDTVAYEYNLANKQTEITYPNGKAVSQEFDKAGRLQSVSDWLGNTTSFAYNRDSNPQSTSFPEGTGNLDEYVYDRADQISEVAMKQGKETLASLGYSRDKVGQVESLTAKGLPGAESEAFSYDANNRLTKAGSSSFEYDAANNLTSAPGTTNTYDAASQLEKGTNVTYTYDKLGERTKATPSRVPVPAYKSTFGSEGSGDGQFKYLADIARDPTNGSLWTADFGEGHERVQHFSSTGEYLGSFAAKDPGAVAVDSKGNVYVATMQTQGYVRKYSPEGKLIEQIAGPGTGEGQVRFPTGLSFDSEGNLWVSDLENNRVEEFSSEGKFTKSIALGYSRPWGVSVASNGNVLGSRRSFAPRLRLQPRGQTTLPRRLQRHRRRPVRTTDRRSKWPTATSGCPTPSTTASRSSTKKANSSTSFGSKGTGEGQFNTEWYLRLAIAPNGNIWVSDNANHRVEHWTWEWQEPEPVPPTTYEYDQAGDLTAIERPEAGETPAIDETYAYDGTGLRASQTVSGTTSHLTWDTSSGLPLLLDDGQTSYIQGPGGLPVEQVSEGAPTFYHHDQLGSTRMLTNASGEAVGTFSYGAYGQPAGSTGAQTTPLGYAGQYTNEQSGLIYMRARVYDPVTGQFLTRDPLLELTRQPYAYTFDNPINGVDPAGLRAEEAELPCVWPLCGPPPNVEKGVEEVGKTAWEIIEEANQDQLPYDPRLTGEEEHQLEIGKCRAEESAWFAEGRKEIGDARQEMDKAARQVAQEEIARGRPPSGPRWKAAAALIGKLIGNLFHYHP